MQEVKLCIVLLVSFFYREQSLPVVIYMQSGLKWQLRKTLHVSDNGIMLQLYQGSFSAGV